MSDAAIAEERDHILRVVAESPKRQTSFRIKNLSGENDRVSSSPDVKPINLMKLIPDFDGHFFWARTDCPSTVRTLEVYAVLGYTLTELRISRIVTSNTVTFIALGTKKTEVVAACKLILAEHQAKLDADREALLAKHDIVLPAEMRLYWFRLVPTSWTRINPETGRSIGKVHRFFETGHHFVDWDDEIGLGRLKYVIENLQPKTKDKHIE